MESFTKHGWVAANPMIVNRKGQILDGQQRFEAAKQLGIPVVYALQGGGKLNATDLLADLQIGFGWTAANYAEWFIVHGDSDQNLNYNMYVKFKDRYKFPVKISLALLCGIKKDRKVLTRKFKAGGLKVADYGRAERWAMQLQEIGEFYDGYKRSTFLEAMLGVMANGHFSFKRFIKKLGHQKDRMVDLAKTRDYLRLIEEIYNFKTRKDDIVRLF